MMRSKSSFFTLSIFCVILLTSCSTSSAPMAQEQSAPTEPTCTSTQTSDGKDWVKGQLDAFSGSDPKAAYAFASESFRARNSLQQFIAIISTNYEFLLNLDSYTVGNCSRQGDFYLFEVSLRDTNGQDFAMEYTLSLLGTSWGVVAASVVSSEGEPSYS